MEVLPNAFFTELKITDSNNTFLFERITPATLTDLNNYQFISSSEQTIIEFDNEFDIDITTKTPADLVFGAVSYGFNQGSGIRLSWATESDALMNTSDVRFTGGSLFSLEAPTLKKSFMKEEIYRVGIQFYKNGNPLFTIPCGDIQAPKLGDLKNSINLQGEAVHATDDYYKNQFLNNNNSTLNAERLLMKVEVRLGCQYKSFIDSYQIVYVERTEENRTILAQGISGPLQRINKYADINDSGEATVPEVFRKWSLPVGGGPLHDKLGYAQYDNNGENDEGDEEGAWESAVERIVTNRSLFYFDSPDIIYDRISTNLIENAKVNVKGRLTTDHSPYSFKQYKGIGGFVSNLIGNSYGLSDRLTGKSFSRVIHQTEAQRLYASADVEHDPITMFASVFSNYEALDNLHSIKKASSANDGAILPSSVFSLTHEVSNNAISMHAWAEFYMDDLRAGGRETRGAYKAEYFLRSNLSTGYRTVFIKTEDNVFTNTMIDNTNRNFRVESNFPGRDKFASSGGGIYNTSDSHALINLKLNNEESVYGGRTKYDLSKNLYIPLGNVIPLNTGTNQSQINTIEGDTYVSLFIRTKNDWHNHKEFNKGVIDIHNNGELNVFNKPVAWTYAVVLETTVEEKMSYDYRHYRENIPLNYGLALNEDINKAYFSINNIKTYVPRPYNYKEDPLLTNVIAASKVKVAGDEYDSFSVFPTNDFYTLEKKYGIATNVTTYRDKLYVIQNKATNEVIMEPSDTITTNQGSDVQVVSGSGEVFVTHKVISNYGTKIRRALAEGDYGFSFFDEIKNEFVKGDEGLSTKHHYQLKLEEIFQDDPVVNSEGWYDDKYKETNLTLTTKSGVVYTLSYNELFQAFNGYYSYDSNIYFNFDDRVFAPIKNDQTSLHELNKGNYLNIFGVQKTMKIGIIVNGAVMGSKIYSNLIAHTNIDYPIKNIWINDNLDESDIRNIASTHFKYQIKEGIHSIPLKNKDDRYPKRGEWAFIELEIESIDNQKIDLVQLVTNLRRSMI